MYIKNILKGFDPSTRVKYFIGDTEIEDIKTVKEFMENGLTTYAETTAPIEIVDNVMILRA